MAKDTNVDFELSCLVSNIKKEVVGGFWYFNFLLKEIWRKKSHIMFSLMLDLKFKTLCLVSTFIGYKEGKAIVEKYDRNFCFQCFFKCHYHLHPLVKSRRGIVN
jgi:hypothetical protein